MPGTVRAFRLPWVLWPWARPRWSWCRPRLCRRLHRNSRREGHRHRGRHRGRPTPPGRSLAAEPEGSRSPGTAGVAGPVPGGGSGRDGGEPGPVRRGDAPRVVAGREADDARWCRCPGSARRGGRGRRRRRGWCARRAAALSLCSVPNRYRPTAPSARTTRWHGTSSGTGLRASTDATARTARGLPASRATQPYGRVSPVGIVRVAASTLRSNSDSPLRSSGGVGAAASAQRRQQTGGCAVGGAQRSGEALPVGLGERRRVAVERRRSSARTAHRAGCERHEHRTEPARCGQPAGEQLVVQGGWGGVAQCAQRGHHGIDRSSLPSSGSFRCRPAASAAG